jgi:carboxypeptidase T
MIITKFTLFLLIICLLIAPSSLALINYNIKSLKNFENEPYEYYNYQDMTDLLLNLAANNSNIIHLKSLETSYDGRNIWLVKLSDNVDENEDEPNVLLMGAHHGNEKPSYEVLIYFIKHVVDYYYKENTDDDQDGLINEDIIDGLDNDEDGLVDEDPSEDRVRDVINNTQIFLIPMVNPDGVESETRKNCAPNFGPFGYSNEITSYGVNINRNYGYDWILYYLFPFRFHFFINAMDLSSNYRGPYPYSENETRAVKQLVEANSFKISLSYHSYSEIILFPWCHTTQKTPDEDLYLSIGENISRIDKYRLIPGSDYLIPRLGGNLGTSENWLYGEHGIIAFTMELCKRRAPTNPAVVLDTCVKHVGVNLYVCERAPTIEPKIKTDTYKSRNVLSLFQ